MYVYFHCAYVHFNELFNHLLFLSIISRIFKFLLNFFKFIFCVYIHVCVCVCVNVMHICVMA